MGRKHTTLTVDITDEAVTILASLDPFERGIGPVAADWIERWCRGNYDTESVEVTVRPTVMSLDITIRRTALLHLAEVARSLDRTAAEVASTIINERGKALAERKRQGRLTGPPPTLP